MLIKLATLITTAHAMQVPGQVTLTNSWPSNDHAEAGGIWEFTIPADMIVNGTGSCSVSIATVGLTFVHFFNAHVGQYNGLGTYEIYAVENWQGTPAETESTFSFLTYSTDQSLDTDVTVMCQDDTPLAANAVLLSSFPQNPMATEARGSFTTKDALFPEAVILSFANGQGPANISIEDPRLVVLQQEDNWIITGLDAVNYQSVWFSMVYGAGGVVPAYEITINGIGDPRDDADFSVPVVTTATTPDPRALTTIEQEFETTMPLDDFAALQIAFFTSSANGNTDSQAQVVMDYLSNLAGVMNYVFQSTGDDQLEIEGAEVSMIAINNGRIIIQMKIRHSENDDANQLMADLQTAYFSTTGSGILASADLAWEAGLKMCEGNSCLLFMNGKK
jgi:hypothetical protein